MDLNMSLGLIKKAKDVEIVDFNIGDIRETYKELIQAQEEVGGTIVYRAKVAAGGGKTFEISTGDQETDTSVASFCGVIIRNHNCNVLFDEKTDDNSVPLCSSDDGITGINTENREFFKCSDCPNNEYRSSLKGGGKACKNMHRLYILTEGLAIPILLSLPPTSLNAFKNYRLSTLGTKLLKPYEVITEFTLEPQTNKNGKKYSTVKFKLVGKLSDEMKSVATYFSHILRSAATPEISSEDYNILPNSEEGKHTL